MAAEVRVKSSTRKGKLVRAYTRKQKKGKGNTALKVAAGALGAAALVGGGLYLKKKMGAKSTALARPMRFDSRIQAAVRKMNRPQTVRSLQDKARNLPEAERFKVLAEIQGFGRAQQSVNLRSRFGASPADLDNELYDAWSKMGPKAKELALEEMALTSGAAGTRQFRQGLVKIYRQRNLSNRGEAFDKVRAYIKHGKKGGDRAGQTFNRDQFTKLRDKARQKAGKSASEIRQDIKNTLGFSSGDRLTQFRNSLKTADFARKKGAKDKKPRKRRRTSIARKNGDRLERTYSKNPYYGTRVDRNLRRTEIGTRSARNVGSVLRAFSNVSSEIRGWKRLLGGSGN